MYRISNATLIFLASLALMLTVPHAKARAAETVQEVNIYSAQQEHLVKPIFDEFTKETGIKINTVTGKDAELVARLQREGDKSPADVFMSADVGNIANVDNKGLLAPVDSKVLQNNIPEHLRDPAGKWFGYTTRARVIFYNKDKVKPDEIKTYADLADPKWKGRLIMRTSTNMYNQSLLSSFIVHDGAEAAEKWAKGVVANFKHEPKGNDVENLKEVASGGADVTLANTYYYGLLQDKQPEMATKVGIVFPNQEDRGTHINIRSAGLLKTAKNKENAIKLLEFLSQEKAQAFFAGSNHEYPANPRVPAPEQVEKWGQFKRDTISLAEYAKHNAEAVKIFDRAGWQ